MVRKTLFLNIDDHLQNEAARRWTHAAALPSGGRFHPIVEVREKGGGVLQIILRAWWNGKFKSMTGGESLDRSNERKNEDHISGVPGHTMAHSLYNGRTMATGMRPTASIATQRRDGLHFKSTIAPWKNHVMQMIRQMIRQMIAWFHMPKGKWLVQRLQYPCTLQFGNRTEPTNYV